MRPRSYRRHQIYRHMRRRLKEDRNQHYEDLSCACYTDGKAMARFKEQPKLNQCQCCCNPRRSLLVKGQDHYTLQERRFYALSKIISE